MLSLLSYNVAHAQSMLRRGAGPAKALADFRVDGAGREWFQVSLERILTEIGKCLDRKLVGETLEAYQFEHVEPALKTS